VRIGALSNEPDLAVAAAVIVVVANVDRHFLDVVDQKPKCVSELVAFTRERAPGRYQVDEHAWLGRASPELGRRSRAPDDTQIDRAHAELRVDDLETDRGDLVKPHARENVNARELERPGFQP
jgi:hypothetical protein